MALVKAIVRRDTKGAEEILRDPHYEINVIGVICTYEYWSSLSPGINRVTLRGTPLMAAVSYYLYRGKQEDSTYQSLIQSLLNHPRCDVNVFTDNNTRACAYIPCTALQCAIASGNDNIKQLLLDDPRFKLSSHNGYVPCSNDSHFAAYHGDTSVTRMLMNRTDFDINVKDDVDRRPIQVAMMGNHVEIEKLLIQHSQCYVTLITAIRIGNFKHATEMLRDPHYDVNEIGDICTYKFRNEYYNTSTTLRGTPLMAAVSYYLYRGKHEDSAYHTFIQSLLNHPRCDVNVFTDNNTWNFKYIPCTALQCTIASGNDNTKQLLLDDPRFNPSSRNGYVPCSNDSLFAAYHGDTGVLRMLMNRADFDINAKDNKGRLPIQVALMDNHVEIEKLLIQHSQCDVTLLTAIRIGNFKHATEMLRDPHYDVNEIGDICTFEYRDEYSYTYRTTLRGTPLMAAVSYDLYRGKQRDNAYHTLIQSLLNNQRCDINVVTDNNTWACAYIPCTALQCAIASGDDKTKQLLLDDPRFNPSSHNGYVPCSNDSHFAAYHGDTDVTRMFMNRTDFDINAKDDKGRLPIQVAMMGNHVEIAKLFIQDPKCNMALLTAIKIRDITRATEIMCDPLYNVNEIGDICQYEYKDKPKTTILRGTPLMAAVSYYLYRGKQEDSAFHALIQSLLSLPRCDVNVFTDNNTWACDYIPSTALQCAIASGNDNAKQLLLDDPRFNPSSHNGYVPCSNDSYFAAYHGDTDVMRMLMDRTDFDINAEHAEDVPLLHFASRENQVEIINLLMQHPECNINVADRHDSRAIHLVAKHNSVDVAQLLVNHPQCHINAIDGHGNHALHFATSTELAKVLTSETNCLLNVKNHSVLCPLHIASLKKNTKMVSMFLGDVRCDVGALTIEGESAITLLIKSTDDNDDDDRVTHWLTYCSTKFSDMINILSASKKVINAANHTLAAAVELCPVDICEALLQKGAKVNSAYPNNETALFCVIRMNSLKKTQLLIKYGADLNVKWMDLNPLQYAITMGSNPKILLLLSKDVTMEIIEAYLTQLSFKCESPLECSIRLGVQEWTENFTNKNNKEIATNLKKWYKCFEPISTKLKLHTSINPIPAKTFHSMAFNCHTPSSHRNETEQIVATVKKVVQVVAHRISQMESYARYHFEPCLGGSMAEGSKTYFPNEADMTCLFIDTKGLDIDRARTKTNSKCIRLNTSSAWIGECHDDYPALLCPLKVEQTFYKLCPIVTKSLDKNAFAPLYLSTHSFVLRDKISHFRFLWRGEVFKELEVHVDMAAAFEINGVTLIAKRSRHKNDISYTNQQDCYTKQKPEFHESDAEKQRSLLRKWPLEARQGLLLAKAARIASICRPDDMPSQGIWEDIDSQDIITSYILKYALLKITDEKPRKTAYEWADAIFKNIHMIQSTYKQNKKKVISALCVKIRQYFKDNAKEFDKLSKALKTIEIGPFLPRASKPDLSCCNVN